MRINYAVPHIGLTHPKSAGSICLYRFINGLSEKGHFVTVVPLSFSAFPDKTIQFKGEIIVGQKPVWKGYVEKILRKINYIYKQRRGKTQTSKEIASTYIKSRFEALASAITLIPDCDVNIATCYQSALAVYLSGKGVPFYQMQHFEKYFAVDSQVPEFASRDAELTYTLPLNKIANSIWLKNEIEKHFPSEKIVGVIGNGIDTDVFYPRRKNKNSSKLRVISYGGRHFMWKGFKDAVDAMKIVRSKYPDIEWIVFGDTSIPPDNHIASFIGAGFLTHDKLAELYSDADIMLCTSWYESFALYPLEAMACGLAVVTTPYGTEEYTRDGENCLIVPAKSPEEMAKAVIKLAENETLRKTIGHEGIKTASQFSWERPVDELEKLLLHFVAQPMAQKRR